MTGYMMAGQDSEVDRLRLQSLVWEPAGRRLLDEVGDGTGKLALDVGCGCLGWLRLLGGWATGGRATGTDIDQRMLGLAADLVAAEGLNNVSLLRDDLFDSALDAHTFDLVHARFQLAPLGRADEQLSAYLRLAAPGGVLVVEDPDVSSWHFNEPAPAAEELITLIVEAFRRVGGDFDAGRRTPGLLRRRGLVPRVRAEVLALEPGHPYLALPLQFSVSLRPRLLGFVDEGRLDALRAAAEAELTDAGRWGTTFTLVQTWATVD